MTTQQMTFPLPPFGTAILTLPEPLTPEAFARLDSAIADALRESCRSGIADAGDDPAGVEFDSWLIHLH